MAKRRDAFSGCGPRRRRQRCPAPLALLAATLIAIFPQEYAAADPEIVSWAGNTPSWNERLGVTFMRQGCSDSPSICLQRLQASAKAQRVDRWALAVKRDASQWPDDALEYSQLSLVDPLLVEIDIDDFLGAMKAWHVSTLGRANQVLETVTRNLKRQNPRLRFGITIYEDELDSNVIAWIPAETRGRVDRVSLYLHYRANAGNLERYLAETQRLFPQADIWAGSYAYDRIDYLPCAQSGQRPCSVDEETDLYRDSLRIQLRLLDKGSLAGIEFYPGFFGLEERWHGWGNTRICKPERRSECIENTRRMRAIAAEELEKRRTASGSPGAIRR